MLHSSANTVRSCLSLAVVMLVIACGRPVPDPSGQKDIYLHGEIDRPTLEPGEVATVTFRLESVATTPVVLHFNTGCQIMPYVVDADTGVIVHPEDGTWACTMALTTLELPAGASEIRELRVQAAGTEPDADVSLPPGEYLAYARLEDREYQLVSTSIPFTVR